MKTSFENYTRLAKSISGMSSLWKGTDHLVYVRGSGFLIPFSEEYKRYRFQDIQVISVAKKSRIGLAILHSMGVLMFAGPIALILALVEPESFGIGTAIVVSLLSIGFLFCLSLLIRHLILGPTCTCDIQTNLSRDRIRPLNRYLPAMEVLGSVEEEIRKSQRGLLDDQSADGTIESRPAAANLQSQLIVPMPVLPTFVAAVVFGLGCLAALHLESLFLTGLLIVILVVVSILLTFSLIMSIRKATPESIRSLLWVTLGLLFLFIGAGVIYLLVTVAGDPAYTIGLSGPLEAFTGIASEGGLPFYIGFVILSLALFVAGLAGVVQTGKWSKKLSAGKETKAEESVKGEDREENG